MLCDTVPCFFVPAGSEARRMNLFGGAEPLLRRGISPQSLAVLDPRKHNPNLLDSLTTSTEDPMKMQDLIWQMLAQSIGETVRAQQAQQVIWQSLFGIEAVLIPGKKTNQQQTVELIQRQKKLVSQRVTDCGVKAPIYVFIETNTSEGRREKELVEAYMKTVLGQEPPVYVHHSVGDNIPRIVADMVFGFCKRKESLAAD